MSEKRWPRDLWSYPLSILLAIYIVIGLLYIIIGGIAVESIMGRHLSLATLGWIAAIAFPLVSIAMLANTVQLVLARDARGKVGRLALGTLLQAFGASLALQAHHSLHAVPVIVSGAVFIVVAITAAVTSRGAESRTDAAAGPKRGPLR